MRIVNENDNSDRKQKRQDCLRKKGETMEMKEEIHCCRWNMTSAWNGRDDIDDESSKRRQAKKRRWPGHWCGILQSMDLFICEAANRFLLTGGFQSPRLPSRGPAVWTLFSSAFWPLAVPACEHWTDNNKKTTKEKNRSYRNYGLADFILFLHSFSCCLFIWFNLQMDTTELHKRRTIDTAKGKEATD